MNVAIWGAGKFGKYVFSQLKSNDAVQITCFIDNGICKDEELGGICSQPYDIHREV